MQSLQASYNTNTFLPSVSQFKGKRSAGVQSGSQRHSKDQTPPSTSSSPSPSRQHHLTSPLLTPNQDLHTHLSFSNLCGVCCVCSTQAYWNTTGSPDAPEAGPTFDLARIDSSPGLWGCSPLTSEVAQLKPANHSSLWFTRQPLAQR